MSWIERCFIEKGQSGTFRLSCSKESDKGLSVWDHILPLRLEWSRVRSPPPHCKLIPQHISNHPILQLKLIQCLHWNWISHLPDGHNCSFEWTYRFLDSLYLWLSFWLLLNLPIDFRISFAFLLFNIVIEKLRQSFWVNVKLFPYWLPLGSFNQS